MSNNLRQHWSIDREWTWGTTLRIKKKTVRKVQAQQTAARTTYRRILGRHMVSLDDSSSVEEHLDSSSSTDEDLWQPSLRSVQVWKTLQSVYVLGREPGPPLRMFFATFFSQLFPVIPYIGPSQVDNLHPQLRAIWFQGPKKNLFG